MLRLLLRQRGSLLLPMIVGVAAAGGVYWSAWQTVPKVRLVPAVVVTKALAETESVTSDAVAVRQLPDTALPPGALSDAAAAVGKTTARPLLEGQVLTERDLLSAPLRRGLAEGEVGVGVRVPEAVGPALRPGDRVNVVAVPKLQPGSPPARPVMLLTGKRIVALYDAGGAEVARRGGASAVVSAVAAAGRMDATAGVPAYAVLALTTEESLALRDVQRTADLQMDVAPW